MRGNPRVCGASQPPKVTRESNDLEICRKAVDREASALRAVVILAATFPGEPSTLRTRSVATLKKPRLGNGR